MEEEFNGLKVSMALDTESYVQGVERINKANKKLEDFLNNIDTKNTVEQLMHVIKGFQRLTDETRIYKEMRDKAMESVNSAKESGDVKNLKELCENLKLTESAYKKAFERANEFRDVLEVMYNRAGVQKKPIAEMFFNREQLENYESLKNALKGIGKELDAAIDEKNFANVEYLNTKYAKTVEVLTKIETAAIKAASAIGEGLSKSTSQAALDVYQNESNVESQKAKVELAKKNRDEAKEAFAIASKIGDATSITDAQAVYHLMEESVRNAEIELQRLNTTLDESKKRYDALMKSVSDAQAAKTPMILSLGEIDKTGALRTEIGALKEKAKNLPNEEYYELSQVLGEIYKKTEELHGIEDIAAAKASQMGAAFTQAYSALAQRAYEANEAFFKQNETVEQLIEQLNEAENAQEELFKAGASAQENNQAQEKINEIKEQLHQANLELTEISRQRESAMEAFNSKAAELEVPKIYGIDQIETIERMTEVMNTLNEKAAQSSDLFERIELKEKANEIQQGLNRLEEQAIATGQAMGPGFTVRFNQSITALQNARQAYDRQKSVVDDMTKSYNELCEQIEKMKADGAGAAEIEYASYNCERLSAAIHRAKNELAALSAKADAAKADYNVLASKAGVATVPRVEAAKVDFDNTGFLRSNREMLSEMQEARAKMDEYSDGLMRISDALQNLAGFAVPSLTIGGMAAFFNKVKNVRSDMQDIESTMRVFLGNAEKAQAFVDDLEKAAYDNMFEFKELVEGSKQMIAYGVATDQVIDRLNQLSEIATATHAPLMEMVATYNRAKSLGFVDSRAMQSWAVKGLVIKDVLKEMGENANTTRISFDQFNKVLDHVTAEGGMFHGVMNEQMHNISAEIGQLEDNMTSMYNDIGKSIEEPLITVVKFGGKLVENWQTVATALGSATAAAWLYHKAMTASKNNAVEEIDELQKKLEAVERTKSKLELRKDIKQKRDAGLITAEQADTWQNLVNKAEKKGISDKDLKTLEEEAEKRIKIADALRDELEMRRKVNAETSRGIEGKEWDDDIKEGVKLGSINEGEAEELQNKRRESEELLQIAKAEEETYKSIYEEAEKNFEIKDWESEIAGEKLKKATEYRQSLEEAYGIEKMSADEKEEFLNKLRRQVDLQEQINESREDNSESTSDGNSESSGENILEDGIIMERAEAEELLKAIEEEETAAKEAQSAAETRNTAEKEKNSAANAHQAAVTRTETVARQRENNAVNQESVAEGVNTKEKTKNTIATRLSSTATKMFKNAVDQAKNSVKAFWASLVANPLGPIIAALTFIVPLIMSLFESTEETTSEIDKFGKEAIDSKNKVMSLYAVLETANKDTKLYKDALKELTNISKEYNLNIDKEKDLTQQLIEKKEELIRLIMEEGRQKQVQAAIQGYMDENSKLIYGEDGKGGVKGAAEKEVEQYIDGISGKDAEVFGMFIAQITDNNQKELEKIQAKLSDAQKNLYNATTEEDKKIYGDLVKQYLEDRANKMGYDKAIEYLKNTGKYDQRQLDEYKNKTLYYTTDASYEASKILPQLAENRNAMTAMAGSYSTTFNAKPPEELNPNDPEALKIAYTAATESINAGKDALKDFNKSLKDNEKESKKKREVKIDTKSTTKAKKDVKETTEAVKDADGVFKKVSLQKHEIKITSDTKGADKAKKAVADTGEAISNEKDKAEKNPITPAYDSSNVEKGKKNVSDFSKAVNKTQKGFNDNPLTVKSDESPLTSTKTQLGNIGSKVDELNGQTLANESDNTQLDETAQKQEDLESNMANMNSQQFKVHLEYTDIAEAYNLALKTAGVMSMISEDEKWKNLDVYVRDSERTVFSNISKYVNDKAGKVLITPGMDMSRIASVRADKYMDPWMKIYWQNALNAVRAYNFTTVNGKEYKLDTVDAIYKGAMMGQTNYKTGQQMSDMVDVTTKDGKRVYTFIESKMDPQTLQRFSQGRMNAIKADGDKQQKERERVWKMTADYFEKEINDPNKTVKERQDLTRMLNDRSSDMTPDDPHQQQINEWLELNKKKSEIPGRNKKGKSGKSQEEYDYEWRKFEEQENRRIKRRNEDKDFQKRDFNISMMKDSTQKEKDAEQLSYDKAMTDAQRKYEDMIETLKKEDMQRWLKDPKNQKAKKKEYHWDKLAEGTEGKKTQQEYEDMAKMLLNYDTQILKIKYDHEEAMLKIREKEEADMREYLKEYGSYKEKELAITEEYNIKIRDAEDEGQRKLLAEKRDEDLKKLRHEYTDGIRDFLYEIAGYDEKKRILDEKLAEDLDEIGDNMGQRLARLKQHKEELASLDMEKLQNGLNWEMVFGDIENYSTEALQRLHGGLEKALDVKGITAENAAIIMEQLNKLDDEMRKRKDVWGEMFRNNTIGGLIMGERDRKHRYADAEKSYQKFADLEKKKNEAASKNRSDIYTELKKISDLGVADADKYMGLSESELLMKSAEIKSLAPSEAIANNLGGLFDSLAQNKKEEKDAKDQKDKAEKEKEANAEGPSKIAVADAYIHGVNDNVQSMLELFDQFGIMDGTFGDGMKSFAESSQYATQAWDSLKNGDIMGCANNAINALGSLGDALGSWGVPGFGSSDRNLLHDLEELARVNETLTYAIQELNADLADSSFRDAADVYKELSADIKQMEAGTRESMQRSAAAYNSGLFGIGGKSSAIAKINSALSPQMWQQVSKAAGTSVRDATDFFNLTSKQMHDVKTKAVNAWTEIMKASENGFQQVGDYMEQFIEYYKQAEEAEKAFQQKMTDTTFDSVASSFKSMLLDLESSSYDFANAFEDMMKNAVVNSLMSDFEPRLKEWYKAFSSAMEDGLDLAEQEDLRRKYDEIAQEAIDKRNELNRTMGWSANSAARGTAGGFATASQDSVNELNGRFTALQIETSAIRQAVDSINTNSIFSNEKLMSIAEGMGTMRFYGQMHLEELQAINKNTRQLYEISSRLEQIEKNTQYM